MRAAGRARLLAVLSLGATAALAAGEPVKGPSELSSARFERFEGGMRWDAAVPGVLVAHVLPRSEGGRKEVWLLVSPRTYPAPEAQEKKEETAKPQIVPKEKPPLPPCPEAKGGAPGEGPLALYRGRLEEGAEIERVLDEIPADATLLAVDLDGDGRDEVLLARTGELSRVDRSRERATLEPLLAEPDLHVEDLQPEAQETAGSVDLLFSSALGRLTLYGKAPDGGTSLAAIATVDLPILGADRASDLRLESPLVEPLGRNAEGALLFATRPRSVGSQRLVSTVLEISPGGESRVMESWARLPEPERVLEHRFLLDEGRPILFLTTMASGKLALFGEKRIRLFSIEQDRSRLGLAPLFAADSRMNLWQSSEPRMTDANADGREDLIVGYWKGLKDDRVVLDAYVKKADGTFSTSARSTALDIEDGDRSFLHYGADLDGDGVADLLVRGGKGWQVHSGRPSKDGGSLVTDAARLLPSSTSREPATTEVTVSVGSDSLRVSNNTGDAPTLVDLDGDNRVEILVPRRGDDHSPGGLEVLWLEGSPAGGS